MTSLIASATYDDIEDVPSPSATSFLVGHEAAWHSLIHASQTERMHHAWLLQGSRGIGKATLAVAFARHLLGAAWRPLVEGQGIEFDASDAVVRQIASGSHPNVVHVQRAEGDRGGFKTQITVDEVRRLQAFFRSTATPGWRIAILDPADDFNRNAANALLKILEEPPARSIFLIVNHAPGRLLPTIRSRCRTLRFAALDAEAVGQGFRRQLPSATETERALATQAAQGSLRRAFLFHQGGGADVLQEADRVFAGGTDWQTIHSLVDALGQKGRETSWDLFRDRLFQRLSDEAKRAVTEGRAGQAAGLAAFCQDEQRRWRDATAFNLDRKQTVLSFISGLQNVRVDIER